MHCIIYKIILFNLIILNKNTNLRGINKKWERQAKSANTFTLTTMVVKIATNTTLINVGSTKRKIRILSRNK